MSMNTPDRWLEFAIKKQRNQYGKDLKDILANILQDLWSKKFDMVDSTYIDVVMKLNNNQIPIYEIKRKSLKRII